jgi:hypothetical protein
MNRVLGLVILSAAFAVAAAAQQLSADKVPANVKQTFESRFQRIKRVEWKLKTDQNFEAEFKLRGAEVAAKFDSTGKWLETETTIARSDLTRAVRATIVRDFRGYRIIESQKLERCDDQESLFEVHVENAKEILKLQFFGNGTLFSKSDKQKKKA